MSKLFLIFIISALIGVITINGSVVKNCMDISQIVLDLQLWLSVRKYNVRTNLEKIEFFTV